MNRKNVNVLIEYGKAVEMTAQDAINYINSGNNYVKVVVSARGGKVSDSKMQSIKTLIDAKVMFTLNLFGKNCEYNYDFNGTELILQDWMGRCQLYLDIINEIEIYANMKNENLNATEVKDSNLDAQEEVNAVAEFGTNEATKIAVALIEQTYIVKGSIKDVETLCECKKKVDYYLGLACTSPEDLEAEYRSMYDELFENVSDMLRIRHNLTLNVGELGGVYESFDFEGGKVRFMKDGNYDDNYKYVAFITSDETEIFPLEGSPYVIADEIVKILYFA